MRNLRKITRSARKLGQQSTNKAADFSLKRIEDFHTGDPASLDDKIKAHQAVEDSLVEIFDNVVTLVVNELRHIPPTSDDYQGPDKRKMLL